MLGQRVWDLTRPATGVGEGGKIAMARKGMAWGWRCATGDGGVALGTCGRGSSGGGGGRRRDVVLKY